MNIQPSVTVWTVLCFLALMLILDRLLFRPLLSFMDKRQEKIDRARREKAEALKQREETVQKRREEHEAAGKRALSEAIASLDALEAENARRIEEKKAENARRLAALDTALEAESERITAEIGSQTEPISAAITALLSRGAYDEG